MITIAGNLSESGESICVYHCYTDITINMLVMLKDDWGQSNTENSNELLYVAYSDVFRSSRSTWPL